MMRFATGYRKDSRDYGYPSHHKLVAATPPSLATPDHLQFRKGFIYQDGAGMCTGMGCIKRPVQLWLEMNGYASQPMVSGDGAYKLGRAQERIGQNPDALSPLEDQGAEPGLVLRAARKVGLFLETDLPDPSTATERLAPGIKPWSIARINEEPSPDLDVKAYDMAGLEFHEVTASPSDRWDVLVAMAKRRVPWALGMWVDSGVQNNTGELVKKIDLNDPDGGGHMITGLKLDEDNNEAIIDNWWDAPAFGIEWGLRDGNPYGYPRGTWRLSRALLETHAIQLFGVTAAPLSLRKAAA